MVSYTTPLITPCQDRNIFAADEWALASWMQFHDAVTHWVQLAQVANAASNEWLATANWQALLGQEFFPATVSA